MLRGYYHSALKSVNAGDDPNLEAGLSGNRTPRLHLKQARLNLEEALGACLLPSLQLIPANPAVGQEIWAVLSLLPYEVSIALEYSYKRRIRWVGYECMIWVWLTWLHLFIHYYITIFQN